MSSIVYPWFFEPVVTAVTSARVVRFVSNCEFVVEEDLCQQQKRLDHQKRMSEQQKRRKQEKRVEGQVMQEEVVPLSSYLLLSPIREP